jgi:septal ring factor EnvC (AmiA/AmiB activator)
MPHPPSATRTEEKPKIQNEVKPKTNNGEKPKKLPAIILTAPEGGTYRATADECYIHYRLNRRELFNLVYRTQWKQRRKIEEVQREVAMERSERKRKTGALERELADLQQEKKQLERKLVKEQAERRQSAADLANERNNIFLLSACATAPSTETLRLLHEFRAIDVAAKNEKLLKARRSENPTSSEK